MTTGKRCRWGILGTAQISQKNWQSIRLAGNAELTAVASRNVDRSLEFIQHCQSHVAFESPPKACGSYDELLDREDVDAVYVPLPTGLRAAWLLKAAQAGKHVLSEKPCGASAAEVAEVIGACEQAGVQFMDGVMFMHSARLAAMRETLDDGESVGDLKRISTQFTFRGDEAFFESNIRTRAHLEPFGCLGDLGWYNIRLILWAMQYQSPKRVTARMLDSVLDPETQQPVPTDFNAELLFEGGVSAGFYCSFLTQHTQWAAISGTNGALFVPDFVLPFFGNRLSYQVSQAHLRMEICDTAMEDHRRSITVREYSNSDSSSQETNMFRRFSDLVLSGSPDPFWPRISLQTQRVMDACLKSAVTDRPVDM